ncbi:uncharacterized protein F54H12.2 [Trichonephila clavipes]|uniref:Uncharacterized protein F54H12.2 n=1 Tax=Trichonephila clavipes TaxID=2585209 RepID=A0A8X6VT43_TRICX|nr:uncharacterized protein F54H12.2 [Trichonephila clavipes]
MLVPYTCCLKQYEDYFIDQAGSGLSYYQGQSFQKGYGIGRWFKRLFRSALLFLSRGAKSIGKEVLRTGAHRANDLLEGRNLQKSAEERAKEMFHPIANVSDGAPIEFVISGSGEEYLDLSQTQFYVRAKILKSSNTYAYRAIIETLLNHGYDSKISQLTSEVYYKDTAGRMNIYDEDKDPNEGFN